MLKVAVIMGSDSDFPKVKSCLEKLKYFGIPFETHVYSAHRTPEEAANFAKNAKSNGFGVIISAAGMAAHLGGVLAAYTTLPIIGIPVKSNALEGLDAMLSTIMMPPGVPVATVAIDGCANAAVLAAQIIALTDENLANKLAEEKVKMAEGVRAKDAKLQEEIKNI
ncbi:MAG: 5-(carboxyamino)imidazole ribonucleotide mutase [Clostridia bacterium]|nr:5-(carboxyamino)imidazole ribonucleotide mutase [Clostridia bacterium]